MKRKIIKLGQATYVASLPSKWMREHNLKKGDYLDVVQDEQALVIRPAAVTQRKSQVTIDVWTMGERSLRNVLNQTYRKGFDVIRLRIGKERSIVHKLVRTTLLGFEVVRDTKELLVIENIVEPSEEKYETLLRRLFLVIKEEAGAISEEVEAGKVTVAKRKETKHYVDTYTNFLRRMVIKHKKGGPDAYLLYYMLSMLSLVHHAYYYLALELDHKPKKLSVDLLKAATGFYDRFYQAFYQKDLRLATDLQEEKKQLLANVYQALDKETGDGRLLYHVGEIIRCTQMASTALFGFIPQEDSLEF